LVGSQNENEAFKPAAVLILLYNKHREDYVILTKRTTKVSYHDGEISFPGGRYIDEDDNLETTALREGSEEIGIDPKKVRMLGVLQEVQTFTSKFKITPFIARCSGPYEFRVNTFEVEEIIEVPLSFLRDKKNCQDDHWIYKGEKIWGVTARILKLFLDKWYVKN
jgi:8-oxo-dGTP pyrophosphatase MutT (NUDIX family)